jgi:hypothetical protein
MGDKQGVLRTLAHHSSLITHNASLSSDLILVPMLWGNACLVAETHESEY